MICKSFAPQNRQIPSIGQGTWHMPEAGKAREKAMLALRRGIELGMVHIDTAEMYTGAEELLGETIKGLPRDQLFIVSKVLPTNASHKGTMRACEYSLKRLGIDHLDCYLLHWRGSIPLEETMSALEELVQAGKILSLGVSNFDVADLEEANLFLRKEKIACDQVLYNLGERGLERKLLPYCKGRAISIVGYSPFAKLPAPSSGQGKLLAKIANKHSATVRQILLAFVTRDESVFTLSKASVATHVEENARASEIQLDQENLKEIDQNFSAPSEDIPLAIL